MKKMPKSKHKEYGEIKKNVMVTLTPTGTEGLDKIANTMNVSKSELLERIGRGLIVTKKTAIGEILLQLLEEAKGQLERYEHLIKSLHIESSKTQKYVESLEALLEQLQQSAE
jgi:hypothetical protein